MLLRKVGYLNSRAIKRTFAYVLGLVAFSFCTSLQSDDYQPLSDTEHLALQGRHANAQMAQLGMVQSYSGMFWHSL